MKKVTKLLAGVVLAASVAATAGAFAGCAPNEEEKPAPQETTYTGEYSYVNWGNIYGVKVDVKVADGKITSVAYSANQPEGWHNITPTWTEGQNKPTDLGHDKADAGLNDYLAKYVGMKVDDVLAIEVATAENGEPKTDDAALTAQGGLLYTGATQTSGRIILAVQDALGKSATSVYGGSATTNYRGTDITANVFVTLKDGKVEDITLSSDSTIGTSDRFETTFNEGVDTLKASLKGKTVDQILALETTYDAASNSLDTVVTGATVSSNLYVAAVKDAFSETYTGEYSYENSWAPGNFYGVKVEVTVNTMSNTIASVKYAAEQPENWVNVTPSWDADGSKAAGVPDYLKKYVGKTVDEVLAVEVPTTNGQPNTDEAAHTAQGDLLYTGATQTSGRIILAVQNALEDLAK